MASGTSHGKPAIQTAQLVLACENLADNMAFFIDDLGFQLESISPADSPRVATLSAPGLRIRLVSGDESVDSVTIRMPCDKKPDETECKTAPNGTRIEFYDPDPGSPLPGIKQSYVLSSLSASSGDDQWIRGRAGMLYRDLIPDRQNGRFIASHIKIPDGGNIEDYPHFHDIRFQMIYCFKGWVRLVYEDQGEEFILKAGDCVLSLL